MIRPTFPRVPRRLAVACVAAAVCGLLPACWQNPTMTKQELRNLQEYAPYRQAGHSIVEGQVVLRLPSGEELYGGNCQVRLLPVSTATTQYINSVVLPGAVSPPRKELESISWVTQADSVGRFRFTALPAGSYYVTCPIAWIQDGKTRQGIALGQADVGDHQRVEVTVTRGTGKP